LPGKRGQQGRPRCSHAFQNETFVSHRKCCRRNGLSNPSESFALESSPRQRGGASLAIILRMDNTNTRSLTAFLRVIRAFAEGSVVAFGFALAILAVGMPIVLSIRGLYEGLSWLTRLVGGSSAFVDAIVSVSSVAGGVILTVVFIKLLVRFFHWRRRFRTVVMTGHAATARVDQRDIAQAA